MNLESTSAFEENFRSRVARQKREKMRARLLRAIMKLRAESNGLNPLIIDDVIKEAAVSRGTFYKYFNNIDEAVKALGQFLLDDILDTLLELIKNQEDTAKGICLGFSAMMIRASIDPVWGAFVLQTEQFSPSSLLLEGMRLGCEEGRKAGLFKYSNVDVAVDFHAGLTFQAMRRMGQMPYDEAYVMAVAAFALSGLGVERRKAAAIARSALRELIAIAPERLSWWPADFASNLAAPPRPRADQKLP